MYLEILIAGFGGGAVRGLIGYTKHQYAYKNVGFHLPYFCAMMFISGIVGVICAMSVYELGLSFFNVGAMTPALGFVFGYAGGDIIENIYKIILKKSSLYPVK
ncbi:hypothetical protein KAW43_03660 [Candidatus Parcubacteria bacterium]|jgi:hypothetical protein|nr:hypothetical protein [Candidatus Parcubacteria bacterium]